MGSYVIESITKEELTDLYVKQGKTIREIASIIGATSHFVWHWCLKYHIRMRSASKRVRLTRDKIKMIVALYKLYHNSFRVGKAVGLSHVWVINVLRREGVKVSIERVIDEQKKEYIKENSKNKTLKEMSQELGISWNVVRYWVWKLDLPKPPRESKIPRLEWKNILDDYNNRVPYLPWRYGVKGDTLYRIIRAMGGTIRKNRWA